MLHAIERLTVGLRVVPSRRDGYAACRDRSRELHRRGVSLSEHDVHHVGRPPVHLVHERAVPQPHGRFAARHSGPRPWLLDEMGLRCNGERRARGDPHAGRRAFSHARDERRDVVACGTRRGRRDECDAHRRHRCCRACECAPRPGSARPGAAMGRRPIRGRGSLPRRRTAGREGVSRRGRSPPSCATADIADARPAWPWSPRGGRCTARAAPE